MVPMDLQKAYDSVEWKIVEDILAEMSFLYKFIKWIMLVIQIETYRYKVKDSLTNNLQAQRGLRQGDPLSPLIFVLIMEYLPRLLVELNKNANFNYHSKCENLNIVNLSFTDGLLMFARGIPYRFN